MSEKAERVCASWLKRLKGCQRNVDVWQQLLSVRKLVLQPEEDNASWLEFVKVCKENKNFTISSKVLSTLMGGPEVRVVDPCVSPQVANAYLEHLWDKGECATALEQLRAYVHGSTCRDPVILSRCYRRLGKWELRLTDDKELDMTQLPHILESFRTATEYNNQSYRSWHAWAYNNFKVVSHYERMIEQAPEGEHGSLRAQLHDHLLPAIQGFFKTISLTSEDSCLQDALRLLTLWFRYGHEDEVQAALLAGFGSVSIDTWLHVLPQIIARLHTLVGPVRKLIHDLLAKVGRAHPQSLIYSLMVASKSQSLARKQAAMSLLDQMREYDETLVREGELVSKELIRSAILWHELWHEGLEEASRQYFGDQNVEGMLSILAPLHAMLDKGPETIHEANFKQTFGRDLQEAKEWCNKFKRSQKDSDLNHAWELYYHVFRRINKQLPQMTSLELQHISPELLHAEGLKVCVPGTYRSGSPVVFIESFHPTMSVITSKQRPRKLTIRGQDGNAYVFLLKGHEDLRQDERVMQLFGLCNTLLSQDLVTSRHHLNIQRYSVCPLSPNSGVIGWVPHHDTLHALIKEYRDSRKIVLNIEHRLMLQMNPDYEHLTLMQKVEVFEHALNSTNGMDVDRILWLKSQNSEAWLDRRTTYTRSLAVMSMVGYVLGLGDRHPSNLMLSRITGKILHIDFGDCFEVAMVREKFPEKIPFRLTRMLINAMEVCGIEGIFRFTCNNVMRVMRKNKESLMAVLEAFVHDPLLNWRLVTKPSPGAQDGEPAPRRNTLTSSTSGVPPERVNKRALEVVNRVESKLTGRDFGNADPLEVAEQVQRLIEQATCHERLCQCYIGWCPFW
eukprot:TRINITY_DN1189_c0_g2_i1.p1 TRINITY_DN1189_c0_g2~~TRINITY_DN1189_c0_g2_i1.p1  ORF type:complete len:858 (+),score=324.02 TRINITY_DN1189_c0_g2_i1:40-2574(+)